MSADTSRGVSALAALLAQLAKGEPISAAEFADRTGFARSSIFDLVRRLQATGFVVRDDEGALFAGPAAYDLAWSSHGLVGLRGPAEAVLLWLRDQAGCGASLLAGSDALLTVPGPASRAGDRTLERTLSVAGEAGAERLVLRLRITGYVDQLQAKAALLRAVSTLEHHISTSTPSGREG